MGKGESRTFHTPFQPRQMGVGGFGCVPSEFMGLLQSMVSQAHSVPRAFGSPAVCVQSCLAVHEYVCHHIGSRKNVTNLWFG